MLQITRRAGLGTLHALQITALVGFKISEMLLQITALVAFRANISWSWNTSSAENNGTCWSFKVSSAANYKTCWSWRASSAVNSPGHGVLHEDVKKRTLISS